MFLHEKPAESIEQARKQSRTRYFWWINYLTDYTDFDFLWEPVPWQAHQCHTWPSQWQKDSGTYLIPQSGYTEINYRKDIVLTRLPDRTNWKIPVDFDLSSFDWSWHPDPTDPPYVYQFGTQHQRTGGPQYLVPGGVDLKFCDQIRGNIKSGITPIVEIDHMDGNSGQIDRVTKTVRYFDNYKDTLTRIARTVDSEYIWVVSSICNYANFDFSWHPEQWQSTMLHVFASNDQKFGDTFYMHVPSFRERISQFELLDWYDVNFVNINIPRRPMPVIQHNYDSQETAVRTLDWAGPLAQFVNTDDVVGDSVTVPLWRTETKTIVPLTTGATSVIVPRTAVPYIKTQLYDYPYIDKTHREHCVDQPLDIVFVSNGEKDAEINYQWLETVIGPRFNKLHRIDGITGRVAAHHAAARISTTPWYFNVGAKLSVDLEFDWSWQPDRMQQAKHYIFHARNPVNGLVYGHMAIIAYNKQLTLENHGKGLDFSIDQAHEIVPVVSGTANYQTSDWIVWRTAFREVIKLQFWSTDVENEYRLNRWLTQDNTPGQWSIKGAEDAVEYYKEVNGDPVELYKSYEWEWLASYALLKRGLTTVQ